MKNPDLSIITVNWKVADLVRRMLRSIADETKGISYEIFVVDNASGDAMNEVVEEFKKDNPDTNLRFIANDRNLGFAAANNLGIREARGRYVVLLNPDTELREDALTTMVKWLDEHPDVGIAGPKLLNPDGSVQASVRAFPMISDQVLVLLKLHHAMRNLSTLRRYFATDFDYGKTQDADQLMGAALFIRRDVFAKIGLLDEAYFIWFEEVDFCFRAKQAGERVMYVSSARIVHYGGESFSKALTLMKQKYFNASMRTYFRKYHRSRARALEIPLFLGLCLAFLISFIKRK